MNLSVKEYIYFFQNENIPNTIRFVPEEKVAIRIIGLVYSKIIQ